MIINKFSGRGVKVGNELPGTSGFKEVINFGETIGYAVDKTTGIKTATSWGKVHYAKDGVHIVPAKPRI